MDMQPTLERAVARCEPEGCRTSRCPRGRAARGPGDGFAAIVLRAYLVELGSSPFQIGVIATGALLGTAVLTLGAGWLQRRVASMSAGVA